MLNRRFGPARRAERPLFDEAFLRRMERLSLQAQRTLRGNPSSGEHPSRRQLPTSIFSDHRPYTSGDDLRYVDWNAYARQEHVLVKLGETEQDINIHLLLDCSKSMAWGEPARFRVAQQLAGALGYLALAHSDRLHIVPFNSATPRPFGPTQGKGRMVEMLRYIENIKPEGQTNLTTLLQRYARSRPMGGVLVILSDLLTTDGLLEGLQALPPPRWQVLVLHLLDPQELRPTISGPIELEDSETGQRMELVLDKETLAEYRQNVERWQATVARACAQRHASYARLMTNWPLEQSIVPYLRTRRMLA
ncbi:MAG: DUF58 domain-containing protein [Chloroflexaceae bacterium]|nr:DUF58 domain-containing protein [Chloroflexaceae bacterium]